MRLTVLSLGAGVQSSTLALMAAAGEITPMPDCAIFADTGSEPAKVYEWLDWLESRLPFPVYRITAGNLGGDILATIAHGSRSARAPFFTNTDGKEGMFPRQCTSDYKIHPIERKVRELLGAAPRRTAPKGTHAEVWKGISTDESHRASPSKIKYMTSRFPLIELRMSRLHCLEWMEAHGYPKPPRSACTFCPYHDDRYWLDMKNGSPREFAQVVEFDARIRKGLPGVKGEAFLHRTLKPLGEVEFIESDQMDLFGCAAGVCGV